MTVDMGRPLSCTSRLRDGSPRANNPSAEGFIVNSSKSTVSPDPNFQEGDPTTTLATEGRQGPLPQEVAGISHVCLCPDQLSQALATSPGRCPGSLTGAAGPPTGQR